MAFNSVLKKLRLQDDLTQSELADKLGVGKSTVSMWEKGERKPSYEMLEAIADYFNVSMGVLLDEKKPASVSADGLNDKLNSLSPEFREQFVRFLALAKGDPERATRYLAFLVQELEDRK